jgi:hypothetical protein
LRELVYLSDHKLQQFLPDPVPWWRRLGHVRAEVKAPLGSVSIEPTPADGVTARRSHIEKVIADIEKKAQWFESEDANSGDWVFFEDLINYRVFRMPNDNEVVLFLNRGKLLEEHTRLLLHGSPVHLMGSVQAENQLRIEWHSTSEGYWFIDALEMLPGVIGAFQTGILGQLLRRDKVDHSSKERTTLEWEVGQVVDAFDESNYGHRETAARMAGYARVTARIEGHDRVIVAGSPLYVELVR